MGMVFLILLGIVETISAQAFNIDVCDKQIMGNWQGLDCDCNNFDGLLNILEACQPQCKNVEKNIECCYAKCILIDHYMFNGGKANKTAISSLFGTAGDSKVIKNFEECEAIVEKRSPTKMKCGFPIDLHEKLFCTSWLNLAKGNNMTKHPRCPSHQYFARKCFDFYNGVPAAEGSISSINERALIVAMNFDTDPCHEILESMPPEQCSFERSTPWPNTDPSCYKCYTKENCDVKCCSDDLVFFKSGVVTGGKINHTAMSSMFGSIGNLKIVENIKQCEAIVLGRGRDDSESCGIPEDIRKIAYCTFWMNFAKFNTEVKINCVGSREAASKCFDLEHELTSTVSEATSTETMTTKLSTKPEYGSSDTSTSVFTESTRDFSLSLTEPTI